MEQAMTPSPSADSVEKMTPERAMRLVRSMQQDARDYGHDRIAGVLLVRMRAETWDELTAALETGACCPSAASPASEAGEPDVPDGAVPNHVLRNMANCHSNSEVRSIAGELLDRRSQRAGDQWQPIATAPKGGGADLTTDPACVAPPLILLWFPWRGDKCIARWDWHYAEGGAGYESRYGIHGAWIEPVSGERVVLHYDPPSHWQPLPAAPGQPAPAAEAPATAPQSAGDEQVHAMCAYVRGEPCNKCPARVDTLYGNGQPGCHAIAEETLAKARDILRTSPQVPAISEAEREALERSVKANEAMSRICHASGKAYETRCHLEDAATLRSLLARLSTDKV
jgi:hypothetical protein